MSTLAACGSVPPAPESRLAGANEHCIYACYVTWQESYTAPPKKP